MRVNWEGLRGWLESHDKLSGWAQTVGALLALFVAVAVPLWQQRREWDAHRKERAALAHTLSLALSALLGDLVVTFNGLLQLGYMPRSEYHHDALLEDLLQRIRDQEARATSTDVMTMLYTARGALHIVRRALAMSPLTQPLSPGQRSMIDGSKERVEETHREAALLVADCEYEYARAYVSTWRRPIVWLVLRTHFGRSLRGRLTAPIARRQAERVKRGW